MSLYPPAADGQGLYEASSTQKAKLGVEMSFQVGDDVVTARYMKNGHTDTLAAGLIVKHSANSPGLFATALASVDPIGQVAGGLAASCAGSGFAWVIFRGPQSNVSASATIDSAAGARAIIPDFAGGLTTAVSTYATTNWQQQRVLGWIGTASVATGGATPMTWIWN